MHTSLQDAGIENGTNEIWYSRPEYFRDATGGYDYLKEFNLLPDANNLSKTHIKLGNFGGSNMVGNPMHKDQVFTKMQGEFWSPNGEARDLITSLGLSHTSMSIGDIIVEDGRVYMVDRIGFQELTK